MYYVTSLDTCQGYVSSPIVYNSVLKNYYFYSIFICLLIYSKHTTPSLHIKITCNNIQTNKTQKMSATLLTFLEMEVILTEWVSM